MRDIDKTKEQLISELVEMRQRVTETGGIGSRAQTGGGVTQDTDR